MCGSLPVTRPRLNAPVFKKSNLERNYNDGDVWVWGDRGTGHRVTGQRVTGQRGTAAVGRAAVGRATVWRATLWRANVGQHTWMTGSWESAKLAPSWQYLTEPAGSVAGEGIKARSHHTQSGDHYTHTPYELLAVSQWGGQQ